VIMLARQKKHKVVYRLITSSVFTE